MEVFHKNFPSFEKRYFEDEQLKHIQDLQFRKLKFSVDFPTVPWEDLQAQPDTVRTDDGCIHYRNRGTNTVYSYHLRKKNLEDHQ